MRKHALKMYNKYTRDHRYTSCSYKFIRNDVSRPFGENGGANGKENFARREDAKQLQTPRTRNLIPSVGLDSTGIKMRKESGTRALIREPGTRFLQ